MPLWLVGVGCLILLRQVALAGFLAEGACLVARVLVGSSLWVTWAGVSFYGASFLGLSAPGHVGSVRSPVSRQAPTLPRAA